MAHSVSCTPSAAIVRDREQEFIDHILPQVYSCALRQFRHLSYCDREEAVASTVALAWSKFRALILRGKDPIRFARRLARIAVFHAIAGRQVGGHINSLDLFSRVGRKRFGFKVQSIGAGRYDTKAGWVALVVEDRKTGPAQVVATRVDFDDWLSRMPSRCRQIAESLAAGNLPMDVAREFQLSRGRISQLRDEFRRSWEAFQGQ